MPFGLGSILGGIKGFGQNVGGGIKRGVNRLGELRDERMAQMDDGAPSPTFNPPGMRRPITGGFAGNEGVPTFDLGRMGKMRGESGGIVEAMPMGAMPERPNHPPLTGFDPEAGRMNDSLPILRDSVNITDSIPQGQVSVTPHQGSLIPQRQMGAMPQQPRPLLAPSAMPEISPTQGGFQPEPISRRGVPLPAMPNRGSEPTPWSPYEEAKYDYWSKHAKRDEQGNFDPKGRTERNWQSVLQNALLGAAQNSEGGDIGRMIGGAIGGTGGALINPQAGYEHVWDAGHGRQMMQNQGRQDAEVERQRKLRMGGLEEDNLRSQIDSRRANMKDAGIERQYRQAQIAKMEAETKAKLTGRPQLADDYDEETDQIRKVAVYPDGRVVVVGQSGAGQLRREGIQSREQIATDRNKAAMERTQVQQQGAKERATMPRPSRAVTPGAGRMQTGGGDGIPVEARQQHSRVQSLKQKADALWTRAKTATPENKAALEEQARAALDTYNREVEDFGRAYGDFFETGAGEGGWNFIKPKVSASSGSQSTPTSVSRAAIDAFAKEKGISPEEAHQRFAAKGIQVR